MEQFLRVLDAAFAKLLKGSSARLSRHDLRPSLKESSGDEDYEY